MGALKIESLVVSYAATNCYILFDDETRQCCVIDPGASPERIKRKLESLSLVPSCIVLTHGHFDHIGACPEIKSAYGIDIIAMDAAAQELKDTDYNMTGQMGDDMPLSLSADVSVSDGQELTLCGHTAKIIHTPGHTQGSMCIYFPSDKVLISGDTLFCESLGRYDFPGGNGRQEIRSITEKLFTLPGDTVVYPGHGEVTTIAHELKYNPVAEYIGRL